MEIELRRLNLIYGANSNGKSSIFRALRLVSSNIYPSFAASDSVWNFNFAELSLQSFTNAVNMNNSKKQMSFNFAFNVPAVALRSDLSDELNQIERELNEVRFQMNHSPVLGEERIRLAKDLRRLNVRIAELRLERTFEIPVNVHLKLSNPGILTEVTLSVFEYHSPDEKTLCPGFSLSFSRTLIEGAWEWNFKDQKYKYGDIANIQRSMRYLETAIPNFFVGQDRTLDSNRIRSSEENLYLKPFSDDLARRALDSAYVVFGNGEGIEISGGQSYPAPSDLLPIYKTVDRAIEVIWRCFFKELKNIEFVGPIREIPQLVLGKDSWFHSLKEDSRNRLDNSQKRFKAAKKAFEELTEGQYGFEFSELQVNSQPTGFWALQITSDQYKTNLQNVGVGISQVLPVIFALFGANRHNRMSRITLIEQPELHLHPKLQSDLADVVISAIDALPERQLFIETHSENLLLRVMRRIRESKSAQSAHSRKLTSSDVSVMFVEKGKEGAIVKKLALSRSGEMLSEWPLDFVDLRLDDVI